MLQRLTIRGQLTLLVGTLAAGILLVGALGLYAAASTDSALEGMFRNRVVPLRQLKTIADMYAVNVVDNAHKANNGNVPWPVALAAVDTARRTITRTWREYLPTYESGEEQQLMAEVVPLMARADSSTARLTQLLAAHDVPGLQTYVRTELYQHIDSVSTVINQLANLQLTIADQDHEVSRARYVAVLKVVIAMIVLALAGAILLGVLVVRHVTRALREAVRAADNLAAGDLDVEIEWRSDDEVGALCDAMRTAVSSERNMTLAAKMIAEGDLTVDVQPRSERDTLGVAFATMAGRLSRVIGEVRQGAESLAAASTELAVTAESLADGTQEQATSVDGTSNALDRVRRSIATNIRHTDEARQLSARGEIEADACARSARDVVAAMRAIGEKISMVEDMAGQTNTLALLAGIEAARAGEHGRGLAEVATEVRQLAERSRAASVEIGNLAVTSAGTAELLGSQVAALVPFIRATAELVADVGKLVHDEAGAAEEIHRAMDAVQRVSTDSAAATEQLAATAEELSAQAVGLESAVAYFQLGGSAGRRSVIAVAAPRASGAYTLPAARLNAGV